MLYDVTLSLIEGTNKKTVQTMLFDACEFHVLSEDLHSRGYENPCFKYNLPARKGDVCISCKERGLDTADSLFSLLDSKYKDREAKGEPDSVLHAGVRVKAIDGVLRGCAGEIHSSTYDSKHKRTIIHVRLDDSDGIGSCEFLPEQIQPIGANE